MRDRVNFDRIGDLAICRDSAVGFGEGFVDKVGIVGWIRGALECVMELGARSPSFRLR